MGGKGVFFDPRTGVSVFRSPDLVSRKLPSLFAYQATLLPPEPDPASFDAAAAERGRALFEGTARCSTCHSGAVLSDAPEHQLHAAEETGMEPLHAQRSATGKYRTTPLRALAAHPPYFHDGSAATLQDVVAHYDQALDLTLADTERADLTEYLKSL
jgi:cytochrome c peroxidase